MKLSRVFSVLPSLFFAVACAAASSGVDHCEVGCPTGGSAQTVVREAYTLNNNMWSITGPLFERHIATLPAAPEVELPSGYWKIIFIGSSPDKGEYAAFLLDQATPKSASFCDYQVTVEEIERRTHPALSFWSALQAGIARRLKSRKGSLAKEMGCP